jgi:hypothetical protein
MNMRKMRGGGKKNAYLVYFGPPILRSNPKLRTRNTFVGVLLYEQDDWSLCISSYLCNMENIKNLWQDAEKKANERPNKSLSSTNSMGPGFAKAQAIDYNSIGVYEAIEIVPNIISKLCNLTDEQDKKISEFIHDKWGKYATIWQDDHPPSWPFKISWIITFKKGVLSCWEDGTAITRKEIKIADKILTGKQPEFVIDNAANKQRVPRDDETLTKRLESSQIAADDVAAATAAADDADGDFLLVTYPQREEKWNDNRYDFLKTETKKVFFVDADRAPDQVDEEYTRFLGSDIGGNASNAFKGNWNDANKYLKEISEPGQDFTHERPL